MSWPRSRCGFARSQAQSDVEAGAASGRDSTNSHEESSPSFFGHTVSPASDRLSPLHHLSGGSGRQASQKHSACRPGPGMRAADARAELARDQGGRASKRPNNAVMVDGRCMPSARGGNVGHLQRVAADRNGAYIPRADDISEERPTLVRLSILVPSTLAAVVSLIGCNPPNHCVEPQHEFSIAPMIPGTPPRSMIDGPKGW